MTDEIKNLIRVFENRVSNFWNYNGMLEYQDREISHSQMKRSDEYQAAVNKARADLVEAIEKLEMQHERGH
jgi:hypothetical protein